MLARGFGEMERIDLYKSHPTRFTVTEKGLKTPLAALGEIGVTAAQRKYQRNQRNRSSFYFPGRSAGKKPRLVKL